MKKQVIRNRRKTAYVFSINGYQMKNVIYTQRRALSLYKRLQSVLHDEEEITVYRFSSQDSEPIKWRHCFIKKKGGEFV